MHASLFALCSASLALAGCSRAPIPIESTPRVPDPSVLAAPPPASAPAAPAAAPSARPAPSPVKLALSGEGIDVVSASGSVRQILFDAPTAQAVDAVSLTQDGLAPQRARNEECGAGPIDLATWPNGLTVMSQQGRFVGWSVSRAATDGGNGGLATMAGIGPGSTRGELEGAYAAEIRETTLGQEFSAGDVFGLLDGTGPSALISALWAGTSCNFR